MTAQGTAPYSPLTRSESRWWTGHEYGHLARRDDEAHRTRDEGKTWRWHSRSDYLPIVLVFEEEPGSVESDPEKEAERDELLLSILRDLADETGRAQVSNNELERRAGWRQEAGEAVRRHARNLAAQGRIRVSGRAGQANTYFLLEEGG